MKRKHSDNMKLLANIDFSSIQMLKFYEFAGFSCALMITKHVSASEKWTVKLKDLTFTNLLIYGSRQLPISKP